MTELITALAVVFIAAGALLLVANHFSLSSVPFYILAGLIVGAGGFVQEAEIIELAQWGIAFLVFVFGFRVDFAAVGAVIRDSEAAAAAQIVVIAPVAAGVGLALGFDPLNALYLAIAATISSTLVGAGLLEGEIRDNLVHGRLASSVHFFDDLLAIGLILVLSAETFTVTLITSQIGFGVLFLAAALLVYRHGYPLLVRLAGGSGELVLMGSISILIAFLAAAELAGVSIVVGAFAAGIAIRSEESLSVGNGIESIRDFFVAIFFVTVGALVSVPTLDVVALATTLVVLVAVAGPIVAMAAFTYEGYDARTAFLASTSLNQVSELSLVIAIQAFLLGTIAEAVFDAIILAAAVTMILTSFTRRHEETIYRTVVGRLLAGRQTRKIDERSSVGEISDHVVVVGYGRQGRMIVERLEELGRAYVVVENDPLIWDDLRAECRNYVLGDAMATYPWERARVEEAALVVSTVDHEPVSRTILEIDEERGLDADLILRASDSAAAVDLLDRGATYVSVPNVLAGDRLVETVGRALSGGEDSFHEDHLERLDTLERYGFGTRAPDGVVR